MSTPKTDSAAIRQVIRALKDASVTLDNVYDGEENVAIANETQALDAITAVDDAYLNVGLPDGRDGWIRFVLGNDPEEVVCDYTVNLSHVLDALTESWWS